MSVHMCISNPCYICFPELAPKRHDAPPQPSLGETIAASAAKVINKRIETAPPQPAPMDDADAIEQGIEIGMADVQPTPTESRRHVTNESGVCVYCGGTSKDWRGPACDAKPVQPAPKRKRDHTMDHERCCDDIEKPAPDAFEEALAALHKPGMRHPRWHTDTCPGCNKVRAAHAAAEGLARQEERALTVAALENAIRNPGGTFQMPLEAVMVEHRLRLEEARAAGKREMARETLEYLRDFWSALLRKTGSSVTFAPIYKWLEARAGEEK